MSEALRMFRQRCVQPRVTVQSLCVISVERPCFPLVSLILSLRCVSCATTSFQNNIIESIPKEVVECQYNVGTYRYIQGSEEKKYCGYCANWFSLLGNSLFPF